MLVSEAEEKRRELEKLFRDSIEHFENETGLMVRGVDVQRVEFPNYGGALHGDNYLAVSLDVVFRI